MRAKEIIRLIEKAGWIEVRQTGSHKIFKHPGRKETISVPFHAGVDVGKGLANKILKQAGLK